MHIEVRGRRSGKTTRMVEALISKMFDGTFTPNSKVLVVSQHLVHQNIIKYLLKKKMLQRFNNANTTVSMYEDYVGALLNRVHFSSRMDSGYDYYYVDEFDVINPDNLFIYDKAYYTTSLDGEFNRFTSSLLTYAHANGVDIIFDDDYKIKINKLNPFKFN